MILRTWRTQIDAARAEEYEQFARERSLPMFRAQPGYRGVLMSRQGADAVVETLWDDRESAERLATSPSYRRTVQEIQATGFLLGDSSTELRHVHLDDRPVAGQPAGPDGIPSC